MSLKKYCVLGFFACAVGAHALCAAPKGHLFIIGGGTRSAAMMSRFVSLAGGAANARIVVFPMASGIPDTVGNEQTASLRGLGVCDARCLNLSREQAQSDEIVRQLDGVTGVFFSGGDQSRLTGTLAGTAVLKKIKQLYAQGAVIGGTSAGAAVMSGMMITGRELLAHDSANAYSFIKRKNVETTPGFGFIDNAIVDQHFVTRKRHNRLLSLVLENPTLVGIGIDEATAIIVNPDGTFDVTGDGSVMVFDAPASMRISENAKGHLGADTILLHLLTAGDSFNFTTRAVHQGPVQ